MKIHEKVVVGGKVKKPIVGHVQERRPKFLMGAKILMGVNMKKSQKFLLKFDFYCVVNAQYFIKVL